jgi:hypothetical protein
MKREQAKQITKAVSEKDYNKVISLIDIALASGEEGPSWIRDLTKIKEFIQDGKPRFSIFAKDGNGKLPFLAFSSIPGEGFCGGAGECLNFCYSFRAWRYPAAFCRQVQNSILLQSKTGQASILTALDKFKTDSIDFRLYVDGDFTGIEDIEFWFSALIARPWLKTYGYSKSWQSLLDYSGEYPENYQLNLSSGSIYGDDIKARVSQLPITRGEFIAVSVGHKVKSSDHGNRDHQKLLREVYGKKAFTCPGLCGDCTKKGHACGSERFKGLDIIIAVH